MASFLEGVEEHALEQVAERLCLSARNRFST